MKTKTTKRFLILLTAVLFFGNYAFSQLDNVGGVSINLDNSPPEKCAILDVKSSDKGVLIPRMTLAQRDLIDNLVEGLQVYITDLAQRGIHYYDGSVWVRLGGGGSVPPGGIIMYYGPITTDAAGLFEPNGKGRAGTPMQGWALCNSNNNTPDMQRMFIVGAKYAVETDANYAQYNNIGGKAGSDMFTLAINNIPEHNHSGLTEDSPVGTLSGTITGSGTATITGLKAESAGDHVHSTPGQKNADGSTVGFNRPGPIGEADTPVNTSSAGNHTHSVTGTGNLSNILIAVDFPSDEVHHHAIPSSGNKNPDALDNRPAYFVVAYIMRIYDDPSTAPTDTEFSSVIIPQ